MERLTDLLYLLFPILGAFLLLFAVCCCGKKVKSIFHIPKEAVLVSRVIPPQHGNRYQDNRVHGNQSNLATETNRTESREDELSSLQNNASDENGENCNVNCNVGGANYCETCLDCKKTECNCNTVTNQNRCCNTCENKELLSKSIQTQTDEECSKFGSDFYSNRLEYKRNNIVTIKGEIHSRESTTNSSNSNSSDHLYITVNIDNRENAESEI